MINLTVIGAGLMGCSLGLATRGATWGRVVYVCDPDEEKGRALAAELQAAWLPDVKPAVADEQTDAVIVATPPYLHTPLVTAALEAGKHVLCEKPLDLTAAGCREMILLARRMKRQLMVGHILRFDPAYALMLKRAKSGEFGESRAAVVHRSENGWDWGGWRTERHMHGGLFFEAGVHEIDLILEMLGRPTRVCADCMGVGSHGMEALAVALLAFEGGRFATLRYGVEDPWGSRRVEVHCDRAVLRVVRSAKRGLSIWRAGRDEPEFIGTKRGGTAVREMEAFCKALAEKRPVPVPGDAGLAAVVVAEAIVKSYEKGTPVTLSAKEFSA